MPIPFKFTVGGRGRAILVGGPGVFTSAAVVLTSSRAERVARVSYTAVATTTSLPRAGSKGMV